MDVFEINSLTSLWSSLFSSPYCFTGDTQKLKSAFFREQHCKIYLQLSKLKNKII